MKRTIFVLSILIVLSMLLSACGGGAAPAAEEPAAEEPATEEAVAEEPAAEEEATAEEPVAEEPAEEAPVEEAAADTTLPRDETLYFAGQQWGSVVGWNPYSANNNNFVISQQDNSRVAMFETPYMYNMLDGAQYPLLADGPWAWNDAMTEITFKINEAAMWSDGTPVTAEDVAYTWASNVKYQTTPGVGYEEYIDTIEAVDDYTVLVKAALKEDGTAVNPLQVYAYLSYAYVIQKDWTMALEERTGGDAAALKADPGDDVVFSGPYGKYFADDTKVIYIRNDNYWGQDASMWGQLPVPKYLAHTIYADNNAGFLALKAGEVDVSQQFNANVQDLWLVDNLPISTYIDEAPYSITASIPSAWYNLNNPGLQSAEVRKAIAMAVDYDTIIANAMTNQSPTFTQVPRSLMNPTDGEQAMYDHDAVADLQWAGNDIEGANALLDEAGIVDSDGDGIRELNGENLSFNAVCPNGWSDWQAAMEVVAAAGEKIGIEITTLFPEWSVYQTVFTEGSQTEYDIFMWSLNGAGPIYPWGRVRQAMSSEFAGISGNWNGNFGGYVNERADEIIAAIPAITDPDELKALFTEAVEIYLTDVPSFALMYRPQNFQTVNESVWTGYPTIDDGLNIPPLDLTDGYAVAGLYYLELVNP